MEKEKLTKKILKFIKVKIVVKYRFYRQRNRLLKYYDSLWKSLAKK